MEECLESYRNHVNYCIELHQMLSELSSSTLSPTIDKIKSSIFYEDISQMKVLLTSIRIFLKIRKSQISNFFQLINSILPKINLFFTKEEIMSLFRRKEIHLYLLKNNFLTINDIATYYGLKNQKLQFFYPELTSLLTVYPTIIEDSKQNQKYREVIEYFTKNDRQKDDPRLKGCNIDSLSVIIQNDDIELFQKTVSHKNIDIQKQKIHISLFESNKCMHDNQLYLIEYAAFHSSIKIFKYLMLNSATFSKDLLKYSFCGGCGEIIHLSEEAIKRSSLNPDLNEILSLTISFHRYELTEYLIENYSIKNSYQNWLISVVSSNYYFFINHTSELKDEVNRLIEIMNNENLSKKDFIFYNRIKKLVLLAATKVDPFFLAISTKILKFDFNNAESDDESQKKICNPLVYAVQNGNLENVKCLLSLDEVDPDYKVVYNTTPFLWACYMGKLEIVKYFVENYWQQNNGIGTNNDDNSHQNENDNSHHNENDNSHQNENDNSHQNENDNSHQNENDNSHQNENDNSHQNENDNSHQNENDNSHQNENDNSHQNENDNSHQNENDNSHQNENDNSHQNENDNSHQNENDNSHQNENDNSHQNENDNSHQNENDNSHQNENDNSHQNENDNSHQNENDNSHQNLSEHLANQLRESSHKTINIFNLVQQSNENALHLATRSCHLDVVEYLVSLNVFDLAAETSQGETALQCAARLGYKEIFDFLKEASLKDGIEVDASLRVDKQRFLPQLHLKSLNLFINFFEGIKNPNDISICLLI